MSTKQDWSVRFEFEADPREETLDDLMEALEPHAGSVGGGVVGRSFGVRIAVKASGSLDAVERAQQIVIKALANVGIDPAAKIIEHEAQTMDALMAHNRGATTETLVGLTDIARLHGFSRQRALELSKIPSFPKPAASLAAGRVWRLIDVERWLATPRKPGRPPKGEVEVVDLIEALKASVEHAPKTKPALKKTAAAKKSAAS